MAEHQHEHHEHHEHHEENEPKSVENPMPSIVHADRVINQLYGGNSGQRIACDQIQQAAARASIVPDVMYYFDHLPEGSYSKQELIDKMNSMIRERGREKEVGLFGVGTGEQETRQRQQRHAGH